MLRFARDWVTVYDCPDARNLVYYQIPINSLQVIAMKTKAKTSTTEKRQVKFDLAEYLLIGGGVLMVGFFVYATILLTSLPGFYG